MSIFSKLLGRSGGDGDPDKPVIVGAVANAEGVGGAQTETIAAGHTETVGGTPSEMPAWHEAVLLGDVAAAKSEVGDEVLVAFEHGDAPAGPDAGGEATGDPFDVKIEDLVPPGEPGGAELSENLSINFAKFEVPSGDDGVPQGDLAAGADSTGRPVEYIKVKIDGSLDEDVVPPGDLAAGPDPSERPGDYFLKIDVDIPVDGGTITGEGPAALDDGSIPTETLSLNFDKIAWKGATGGPGTNELALEDTPGGEAAGGPVGELAKKAAGEQENLESVKVTSYNLGGDQNPEEPPGMSGLFASNEAASATMKESGEKGGTEDINIGVGELQESPALPGGVRVATADVDAAPGESTHSEFSIKKFTDASSHGVVEDDDDGATLETLSVQEPGAIGGAIGGVAGEGDDDLPDLDDLDLDDDGEIDL